MPSRFSPKPIRFGVKPPGEDGMDEDTEGLPRPTLLRLQANRAAGIAEAKAILEYLPAPGESCHCLTLSRMDLADMLTVTLEHVGRCERMHIATLGLGTRNLRSMCRWLDTGAVGSLWLLSSIFWRSHEPALWHCCQTEFRNRPGRAFAACMHAHAKVVTMEFANGTSLVCEGSANLRGSGSSIEALVITNSAELCGWHSRWIAEKVARHAQSDASAD